MKDDTRSKLLFWAVIAIMILLMIVLCVAICEDIKGGQMKDSKSNEFGVGNKLGYADETEAEIECIAINKGVASMERIRGIPPSSRIFYLFDIDQERLLTSSWVKVEHSHIPAQRGKGD